MSTKKTVAIIGAGLAGCEAALVLARLGIDEIELIEARPGLMTPAHKTGLPAELVCSNSLKSVELPTAHGLLKAELDLLDSPLLGAARASAVRAGSALAVDREKFSIAVAELLSAAQRIKISRREAIEPPAEHPLCIIAAGPLVSDKLAAWLASQFSSSSLHFYDAIAPIIAVDSVDMNIAFLGQRWEEQGSDYLNCPFTEEEYHRFFDCLRQVDRAVARDFENERFFEACLPIEVIASRGYQALAFGPLRPIGFIDPRTGKRPFALCQLRRETAAGESFNMVGFQTRLTTSAQREVFRMIPGLGKAEFLRYGSIHRNTYVDSPRLLAQDLSFKTNSSLFLAGQLCGNEGYTESIATGHLAALFAGAKACGREMPPPPEATALGSLLRHVTMSEQTPFTPSNIHFGLIPVPSAWSRRSGGKKQKKELICSTALDAARSWRDALFRPVVV